MNRSIYFAVVGLLLCSSLAFASMTQRVSVSSAGVGQDGFADLAAMSADGRYVAFSSCGSTQLPQGSNWWPQIFVRDRLTGKTECASVSMDGQQGNNCSRQVSISADGRYVAFVSRADNLVPGDSGADDIFVRDRLLQTTERVSVSTTGEQADNSAIQCAISGDGRYVVFNSSATNLVPGGSNGTLQVYLRDRHTGTTEIVSVNSAGEQGDSASDYSVAISHDGRFVAFASAARNLVPEDTNDSFDIFVRDRQLGTTERVNLSSTGQQTASWVCWIAGMSSDGRFVAFQSGDPSVVPGENYGVTQAFVRDRLLATTEAVSVNSAGEMADSIAGSPVISGDGRYVCFVSAASNLVPGVTPQPYQSQVFLRDRVLGTTELVSQDSLGTPATYGSFLGWFGLNISADGSTVAFASYDPNLVPGDGSWYPDIFVRVRPVTPKYQWQGFLPPLTNSGENVLKPGRALSVKFQIADLNGNPVPQAIAYLEVYAWPAGASQGSSQLVATPSGKFAKPCYYEASSNTYSFSLDTSTWPSSADTVYQLVVILDDGQRFATLVMLP